MMPGRGPGARFVVRRRRSVLSVAIVLSAGATTLHAQTDYYNTSAGRPLRIEDAGPVEYHAMELDLAPLRIERLGGRTRHWSIHPETTIGIFPRTQLQIGAPFSYIDVAGSAAQGVAGLEIATLYSFNAETAIPALALAADVSLPVGSLAGEATYGTLKAILTRTLPGIRFHANFQMTAGPSTPSPDEASEATVVDSRETSRWMGGVAVDRTFPLRSLLISAEAFAEQPLRSEQAIAWSAGAGLRYQLSPRWAMDAGGGRRFTGDDRTWYVTLGSAYAFGLR